MKSDAILSSCERYRYFLTRQWDDDRPFVNFIGLNPSTADAIMDDPTIRRCIRFAKDWGYGGIIMTNLFALRTPDPKEMQRFSGDVIGTDNNHYLLQGHQQSALSVAAWGNHGMHMGRNTDVIRLLPDLYCLKILKSGQPGHPLYLKADLKPTAYSHTQT